MITQNCLFLSHTVTKLMGLARTYAGVTQGLMSEVTLGDWPLRKDGTKLQGGPVQRLPSSGFCFPRALAFQIIQGGPKGDSALPVRKSNKRNSWRGLWSECPKQHHGNRKFLERSHCFPDTELPKFAKGPQGPKCSAEATEHLYLTAGKRGTSVRTRVGRRSWQEGFSRN